jgi:hypothetical protein
VAVTYNVDDDRHILASSGPASMIVAGTVPVPVVVAAAAVVVVVVVATRLDGPEREPTLSCVEERLHAHLQHWLRHLERTPLRVVAGEP